MAISDELTRIQNAKTALKTSIEAKGVTVPSGATIDAYPSLVDSIETGGGSDTLLKNLIERDYNYAITLDIPNTITKIGNSAFYQSPFQYVTIPNSVTSIDSNAFYNCTSLKRINSKTDGEFIIPNTVTSIDSYAFQYCTSLKSVTIPDSVTNISSGLFSSCTSLIDVNIPNSVTNIDTEAFQRCSALASVEIPDSVTGIGNNAFSQSGLVGITIPDSITYSIGYYAFDGCTSLTSITVLSTTPPTLFSNTFNNTNNCPIYVPSSSVATYKGTSGWSTYASRIKGYTWTSYDYGVVPTGESLGIRFSHQDIAESLSGGVETATVGFTDGTNTFQVLLDAVNATLLVERMMNGTNYQKEYTLAEGETYTLMFDVPMYFDDTISEGLPWTMEVAEIDA